MRLFITIFTALILISCQTSKVEKFDKQKIRFSQIVVDIRNNVPGKNKLSAHDKIKMVESKLKLGSSFSRMARIYSEDKRTASKGGDTGWHQRGYNLLKPQVEKEVWKLQEGQISKIIEINEKYYIFYCTERMRLKR